MPVEGEVRINEVQRDTHLVDNSSLSEDLKDAPVVGIDPGLDSEGVREFQVRSSRTCGIAIGSVKEKGAFSIKNPNILLADSGLGKGTA